SSRSRGRTGGRRRRGRGRGVPPRRTPARPYWRQSRGVGGRAARAPTPPSGRPGRAGSYAAPQRADLVLEAANQGPDEFPREPPDRVLPRRNPVEAPPDLAVAEILET